MSGQIRRLKAIEAESTCDDESHDHAAVYRTKKMNESNERSIDSHVDSRAAGSQSVHCLFDVSEFESHSLKEVITGTRNRLLGVGVE